jgi:hypothetical protein
MKLGKKKMRKRIMNGEVNDIRKEKDEEANEEW